MPKNMDDMIIDPGSAFTWLRESIWAPALGRYMANSCSEDDTNQDLKGFLAGTFNFAEPADTAMGIDSIFFRWRRGFFHGYLSNFWQQMKISQ
jgi:hypothetical protein